MTVKTGKKSGIVTALTLIGLCFLTLGGRLFALDKKEYKIVVVLDTVDVWSTGIRDGFKKNLDAFLSAGGARAAYTEFDTEINLDKVPAIIHSIVKIKPDLIFMATYPDGFADIQIAGKLTSPQYRFITSNPIPLQTGTIRKWDKPGGNITGVGVFLQLSSMIRLAKMVNPKTSKVLFFSWDAMPALNEWFRLELTRACREEGVELSEFKLLKNVEEEFDVLSAWDKKGPEYIALGGISPFVHSDGTPSDTNVSEPIFVREKLSHLAIYSYDENMISSGFLGGTSIVWYDIGAQLAEKGIKILNGANPGDLAWEYPRKYNIMLNLKAAKDRGITFPQSLLEAAYRVYTDYEGNFLGSKN